MSLAGVSSQIDKQIIYCNDLQTNLINGVAFTVTPEAQTTIPYDLVGAYTLANAGTIKLTKIGNFVNFYIIQTTFANVSAINSPLACQGFSIPAAYRPVIDTKFIVNVLNAGVSAVGILTIFANGAVTINSLAEDGFTNAANAGIRTGANCGYPVV